MHTEDSLELNVILKQVEEYCSFSLGRNKIEDTHPDFNRLAVHHNLLLMKECMQCIVHMGEIPFGGIRDITASLQNAEKGGVLTAQEMLEELHLIRGLRAVKNYESSLKEIEHPLLKELIDTIVIHQKMENDLKRCISEYGEVLDTASHELASIRASIRKNEAGLEEAAKRFVGMHSNEVVDSIITKRSGRAVILVKAQDKNTFGGMVYGDSASGQASYVEPAVLVPYNNAAARLSEKESQEISRILTQLSASLKSIAAEELANLETAALLDTLNAKALWGIRHDAVVADVSEKREIHLIKARHPLIDPKKVVANTYNLDASKKVLLITGPNTGGKTVSMKIIGLCALMSACGMPVTCEEAQLPYFDQVFADIGDDQSVVSSLSSFSGHISRQAEIVQKATKDSLVLLDEAGSGTDPKEGEALAIALLNTLRKTGCITICTTHYDRLKNYGKRHDDILVASVAFDMKKLQPTYKYVEGVTGQSNALEVASRYGLPDSIIKYARFLKNQAKSEEDTLLEKLDSQLNEAIRRNDELNQKLEEVQQEEETLKEERAELEKEKDTFHAEAQKKADAYVEKVRHKADAILKDIRRSNPSSYHELVNKRSKLNRLEGEEKPEETVEKIEYKPGDAVELRNSASSYVCEVLKVEKKNILISMNGREMRVKPSQIRPSIHRIAHIKPEASVNIQNENIFASIPSECNLIGMNVEEGIDKMESYMDQAKLHGLKTFRIIHGDGTGRLRKAVQENLKHNPDVKEYRLGMPQEGGTGATVVTLK